MTETAEQETRRNFLGIPISGDINDGYRSVPQKPLEELAPLMQALLDDPTIAWFEWTQYTPYFNDGDPCIFHVYSELNVRLKEQLADPASSSGDDAEYDDDNDDDASGVEDNKALGRRVSTYDEDAAEYRAGTYIGPDEARYDRCLALQEALGSRAFDNVLLEHFGDHCTVRVSRTGIRIEEYDHD